MALVAVSYDVEGLSLIGRCLFTKNIVDGRSGLGGRLGYDYTIWYISCVVARR